MIEDLWVILDGQDRFFGSVSVCIFKDNFLYFSYYLWLFCQLKKAKKVNVDIYCIYFDKCSFGLLADFLEIWLTEIRNRRSSFGCSMLRSIIADFGRKNKCRRSLQI